MRNRLIRVLLVAAMLSVCGTDPFAQRLARVDAGNRGVADNVQPEPPAFNSAVEPKPLDWHYWRQRHKQLARQAAEIDPPILFLGDSITENWSQAGSAVWNEHFAPLGAVNFGIAADRTQSLRWRIREGRYDRMDPKLVVLLIGTNNLKEERNTPDDTVAGIFAAIDDCMAAFAHAKILLLAVLPCMESPENPHATGAVEVNRALAKIKMHERVHLIDPSDEFTDSKGRIDARLLPDYLHPNEAGYRRLAKIVLPIVATP
ncbi:MAG: GDSL-type esterase/lipase family protein [Planctomycetota bacterium]